MKKYFSALALFIAVCVLLLPVAGCSKAEATSIGMAVEFTDHAACAYIAQDMGWYEEEGLALDTYESYVTGMALASALARGDIQVAYICLIPAINAYANAGVPLKVVAGTHKYGYGLVVNPDVIKSVEDLAQPGIRIGCSQQGSPVDALLERTIEQNQLDRETVVGNVQRMNPPKQLTAIQTGQLDAGIMPEHWSTMAEKYGFEMLLTSDMIWPDMQGSVLIVKQDLIDNNPDAVERLVAVSQKASKWANENPEEAAAIMAKQLQSNVGASLPEKAGTAAANFEITPDVLLRSMERLEYTETVDPAMVQEMIDYAAKLGYIKNSFNAEEILDLSFIQ